MFSGASLELKTCNAALLESTGKSWEEVKYLSYFTILYWLVIFAKCYSCFIYLSDKTIYDCVFIISRGLYTFMEEFHLKKICSERLTIMRPEKATASISSYVSYFPL